jgi:signal transduction histidine kinase
MIAVYSTTIIKLYPLKVEIAKVALSAIFILWRIILHLDNLCLMKPRNRWLLLILCTILFVQPSVCAQAQRADIKPQPWKKAKDHGSGSIAVYWYESRPFIYKTANGIGGIEYDLMEGFKKYLKDAYNFELSIVWQQAESFGDTYAIIREQQTDGIFGASAFSITPERQKEVAFSSPYMSDISVLITSKSIPVLRSFEELSKFFPSLTAITIAQTTYEQDLIKLKERGNLPFKIEYIPSSDNILEAVAERDSAFGFIDLPIYMMIFNEDPSVSIKRQNLFPVKRKGYAIIYPKQSDWATPFSEYFSSEQFSAALEGIIGTYIDRELYHFIESLAIQPNDLVELLTKEKEIQSQDLLMKAEQIRNEARARNFLIALIVAILIFLGATIISYQKRIAQNRKIKSQQKNIEDQNQQLEKRNLHLVALDEEKNNLIRILAHDLRTPINHIQGLTNVLLVGNSSESPEDQKMILQRINDVSLRLNRMISNILDIDSLENNRVKIFMDDVEIDPLLIQVVKSFEKQAAKKDISVVTVPSAQGARIRGDSLFLIQVFENLISNAIKFSEKGKQVEIITRETSDKICICVKDGGPGLTEDDLKLLFKKFQRLTAKPTAGESSIGLGLSIVKKYVELMQGEIRCESTAGKGSNFIVEFPKLKVIA